MYKNKLDSKKPNNSYKKISKNPNSSTQTTSFIESYFFYPSFWQKVLSFTLLPISFIYFLIAFGLKSFGRKKDFGVKIISVGNLVSGGAGKTPFVIALCEFLESKKLGNLQVLETKNTDFSNKDSNQIVESSNIDSIESSRLDSNKKNKNSDIYIILRGYKRKSKGLVIVRDSSGIKCDVAQSGDEAMLIAQNVRSNVLVCENRSLAIMHAKSRGARLIILDDGYRFRFKKFDILLRPALQPFFPFTLPSGYYRLPPRFYKNCNLSLRENSDYTRFVDVEIVESKQNLQAQISPLFSVGGNGRDIEMQEKFESANFHKNTESNNLDSKKLENIESNLQDSKNFTPTFILATAIANPSRLQSYTQNLQICHKFFLNDHDEFDEQILKNLLEKYNANYILMTQKDYVKCEHFALPIALLKLKMKIDSKALQKISAFIES
ncbi:tetraacyldisaccharide 4'-kinase [Helicobacter saguini]|uniref:Tetraacyldisaccharide 4'-kinase n=1 Tax=Helicobacter saguini TaxID=1548018 RepID=A0A6B0HNB1_9HELI|nr:tetraacyldisaccharide 4'-kinase [Helicobacter saguini]MWV61360.1 tetraacyldisaccharide 4'-kinase [Helicobacter saguini]MWV67970.1 tetraacyldisaccharide 4'-kinase [Helicobacter saguini]MWV70562.1 tetraacyldisaccharide 4'-kinase [Helicobacter saguini]MWV72466.1 tetraacyldisaccharide 4'-kinase [Helicobacter saguini]